MTQTVFANFVLFNHHHIYTMQSAIFSIFNQNRHFAFFLCLWTNFCNTSRSSVKSVKLFLDTEIASYSLDTFVIAEGKVTRNVN